MPDWRTNKWPESEQGLCAYDGMEKYFPKDKIVVTGNPVRKDILTVGTKREKALTHFGFDANKKTLLIIGGSLGATIDQ